MKNNLVTSGGPCPLFTVDQAVQFIHITRGLYMKSAIVHNCKGFTVKQGKLPLEIFESFDRLEILTETRFQTSFREWWQVRTFGQRYAAIYAAVLGTLMVEFVLLDKIMDYVIGYH